MSDWYTWRWILGIALAVAVGVGATVWLRMPENLPIRHVSLHGDLRHSKAEALEHIIAQTIDGNLVTQDLGLLEQRLTEYPWISRCRVRRDWPNTLRVHLEEHVPAAHWESGGILNADGVLFVPKEPKELDLLRISGEPGRGVALMKFASQARKMLAPHQLELTRLTESRRRLVTLTVKPDLELVLGRARPLQRLARWLRYLEAYGRHATHPARVIDLRYPNGFAVRTRIEF